MKREFKWNWPSGTENIQPAVLEFKNYLRDAGYRTSVITGYTFSREELPAIREHQQTNSGDFRQIPAGSSQSRLIFIVALIQLSAVQIDESAK